MYHALSMAHTNANVEYFKYQFAVVDYMSEPQLTGDDTYPIKRNLRQIYAFKVLQSYYRFKLEKCAIEHEKKITEFDEEASEQAFILSDDFNQKQDSQRHLFEPDGVMTMSPEQLLELQKKGVEESIQLQEQIKKVYNSYTPQVVTLCREQYNESKQILEEFWLRSGGIIKYITNEDILRQFDCERTLTVYEYIMRPIDNLTYWAGNLRGPEAAISVFDDLASILESLGQLAGGIEDLKRQEIEKANDKKGDDDLIPDIEKQAITYFQETTDLPDIGFEYEIFGFGASLQTDGEKLKLGLETPMSSSEVSWSYMNDNPRRGGYFESYTAVGAKAQGSTDWFKDFKNVQNALGSGKKVLGKIGIGFSNSVSQGSYICMDKNGEIKDMGIIYIRESGGSIGNFGRSERVVVRKSTMTGLAIKQTSTKYRFWFGSISVGN